MSEDENYDEELIYSKNLRTCTNCDEPDYDNNFQKGTLYGTVGYFCPDCISEFKDDFKPIN